MAFRPGLWYRFIRGLAKWAFFKPYTRLKVSGKQNVPTDGPLIVAPVHLSHLDPPVTSVSMPRPIAFMAKKELFEVKVFGPLIRSLGAFPVKRGGGDLSAFKLALAILEEGQALLVFPEGSRGDGVTLGKIQSGVALLAKRSGAKVLPVGISGTERVLPKGRSKMKRGRVSVYLGEPFTYEEAVSGSLPKDKEAFSRFLEVRLLDACRRAGLEVRTAPETTPLPECETAQTESSG